MHVLYIDVVSSSLMTGCRLLRVLVVYEVGLGVQVRFRLDYTLVVLHKVINLLLLLHLE